MKAFLKAAVPLLALNCSALAQAPQVATDLEGKLQWTLSESDGGYKLGLVETREPEANTYVGFLMRCRRTGLNTINTDLFDSGVVGTIVKKNEPLNVSLVFDGREKAREQVAAGWVHERLNSHQDCNSARCKRNSVLYAGLHSVLGDGPGALLEIDFRPGCVERFPRSRCR